MRRAEPHARQDMNLNHTGPLRVSHARGHHTAALFFSCSHPTPIVQGWGMHHWNADEAHLWAATHTAGTIGAGDHSTSEANVVVAIWSSRPTTPLPSPHRQHHISLAGEAAQPLACRRACLALDRVCCMRRAKPHEHQEMGVRHTAPLRAPHVTGPRVAALFFVYSHPPPIVHGWGMGKLASSWSPLVGSTTHAMYDWRWFPQHQWGRCGC